MQQIFDCDNIPWKEEELPVTHTVDVRGALETMDYEGMVGLAAFFERWVFESEIMSPEQRTSFLLMAVDYEVIAEFCGSTWKATKTNGPEDLLEVMARICAEKSRSSKRRTQHVRSYLQKHSISSENN